MLNVLCCFLPCSFQTGYFTEHDAQFLLSWQASRLLSLACLLCQVMSLLQDRAHLFFFFNLNTGGLNLGLHDFAASILTHWAISPISDSFYLASIFLVNFLSIYIALCFTFKVVFLYSLEHIYLSCSKIKYVAGDFCFLMDHIFLCYEWLVFSNYILDSTENIL